MANGTVPLLRAPLLSLAARVPLPAPTAAVRRRRVGVAVCVLVAVTAFVVRFTMVARGGGLGGLMAYDDGVYYSASGALWWGRLPYRDFVLVHPPGIVLVLAPLAGLGRLTHDAVGFELARSVWMLVGSLNAGLVVLATRRSGLLAAAVAGLFYALWTPAALTETTTRLEPLVSLGLLLAVAVLAGGSRPVSPRGQLLAGCALGFALTVKVWAIAPAAVVVLWVLVTSGRRAAARVAGGGALAASVVCLPFWVLAPTDMFRMVVLDQLGRGRTWADTGVRLVSVLGLRSPEGHYWWPLVPWAVTLTVVGSAAVLGSVRTPVGRLAVALFVVQLAVVLVSPSYFSYYAAFLAPSLALMAAGGVSWGRAVRSRTSGRGRLAGAVLLACAVTVFAGVGSVATTTPVGTAFPARDLGPAVSAATCVTADSPDVLILTGLLQRDRRRGCPVLVDLSGLSYDADALPLLADGTPVTRTSNPRWQHDLTGYLFSGDAVFVTRVRPDGFGREALERLDGLPVLRRGPGYELLATRTVRHPS